MTVVDTVPVSDLAVGDTFESGGFLFLKSNFSVPTGKVAAVRVDNGGFTEFVENEPVKPRAYKAVPVGS